jgi:short-subunit dehydrogenase
MTERFVIMGASRGLGREFVKKGFLHFASSHWLLISRKSALLNDLVSVNPEFARSVTADFSKPEDQESSLAEISAFRPTRLIYFAGGGPFGKFEEKSWKDHSWCWEVNFLFPARIVHQTMRSLPSLKQIVLLGSQIAEDKGDPMAASYAASKHALRGLVRSVRAENPEIDLRLYSPGYMDTELLPVNAWPRQQGLAASPSEVAQDLLSWLFVNDESGLRLYK